MKFVTYAKIAILTVLLIGFASCDTEEETEYNLPGEWYTSEEIDFGAYTWQRYFDDFQCKTARHYRLFRRPKLFSIQMEMDERRLQSHGTGVL